MAVASVLTSTKIPATPDSSFFSGKPPRTTTPVRVRTKTVMQPQTPTSSRLPTSSFASTSPLSSLSSPSSPPSPPAPKRKSLESTPPDILPPLQPKVKRQRTSEEPQKKPRKRVKSASKSTSRHSSRQASSPPPLLYRRATSTRMEAEHVLEKRDWLAQLTHDPHQFKHKRTSAEVVHGLLKKYQPYFRNPLDSQDQTYTLNIQRPRKVTLQYPSKGAEECFILAAPKDKDHYNPFFDLEKTVHTIVKYYVPDRMRHMFGPIPTTDCSSDDYDDSPRASRSPSPELQEGSSRFSSLSRMSSPDRLSSVPCSSSPLTSVSPRSSASPIPSPPRQYAPLRVLQRAINTHDGPLFEKAVEEINDLIDLIKNPPLISSDPFEAQGNSQFKATIESWRETGLPKPVLMRVIEENYQRCVGPNVPKLKQYTAFTSSVYGELMPELVYEILVKTKTRSDSLFMDLGSGVGNVVVQAALQTGCRSFGIELNDAPADVAAKMVEPFTARCRMWGLRCGEIELVQGDMLTHPRVDELLKEADVVLVDNKVFEETLNEALKPKFLDLKEGAIVVSLKPFANTDSRITERNVDDMSTIFEVTKHEYHSGSVSWGNGGGSYYIHRVDRQGYAECRSRFEQQQRKSSRRR